MSNSLDPFPRVPFAGFPCDGKYEICGRRWTHQTEWGDRYCDECDPEEYEDQDLPFR